MMENELRQFLKEHGGWILYKRTRRKRAFYYALKWKKGEIYITSETKLPQLTREQVLEKLGKAG